MSWAVEMQLDALQVDERCSASTPNDSMAAEVEC